MDNWKRILKSWVNIPVLILAALVAIWFFTAVIAGIGDTSDNIKANLGDVDSNDNSQISQSVEVTRANKIGDTKTPSTVSPIMSPLSLVSPIVSPSSTPTPSLSPALSPTPKLSTAKNLGKVVINEIAWAGTLASATDEWIELYNTESDPVDISSWRLVSSDDSPDIIFPEETIIQTNAYFLIERSSDDTISDITADLIASFGQGGLNNAGEMIKLFNGEGAIVDMVGGAGEAWYSGDSSLKNSMERIDPMKAGNDPFNWKSFSGTPVNKDAKENLINGTPKTKNSIAIQIITPTPTPTPTPSPTPIPSPTPSPIPSPSLSPTPELNGDTSLRSVVINEIAWMGTATSSNDEWIELYNNTDQTIDLTGWTLKTGTWTSSITFFGSIEPYGFYILERGPNHVFSDIVADITYNGSFSLNNTGSSLSLDLKNSLGILEDYINCSPDWFGKGNNITKFTMERINPTQSGNNPANWSTNDGVIKNGLDAAGNPINGTPKEINSACKGILP